MLGLTADNPKFQPKCLPNHAKGQFIRTQNSVVALYLGANTSKTLCTIFSSPDTLLWHFLLH